jgi:cobalamin biosynthetic protein CobC
LVVDGQPVARSDEPLARHGGRLSVARTLVPDAPEPWIDLSTGINPHRYRGPRATAAARARLPDPMQLAELERVAAREFGVEDPLHAVAMPGTELALRLLPIALNQPRAAVAGPTYSSHADAWRRAGAQITEVRANELHLESHRGAVVIVNPNNPDGALLSRQRVLEMHDVLHANEAWLVIDEAFMDAEPAHSICDLAGTRRAPHLVALRSFGKFYGLAGVRLGFVIGPPSITERLRGLVGDWPLSADALAIAVAAYQDTDWAQRMRTQLKRDAARLDALLERSGFSIVGGTSLFRLVRHPRAQTRFHTLLSAGVLTRPFDYDATLLRFGLPGSASEWRRLAASLVTCLG